MATLAPLVSLGSLRATCERKRSDGWMAPRPGTRSCRWNATFDLGDFVLDPNCRHSPLRTGQRRETLGGRCANWSPRSRPASCLPAGSIFNPWTEVQFLHPPPALLPEDLRTAHRPALTQDCAPVLGVRLQPSARYCAPSDNGTPLTNGNVSFPLASSCHSRCSNAYLTNGCTPASESKIPIELLPTPPRPQVPPRQPNICAASRRRVADTGAYEGRQHSQVLTSDRVGFRLSCEWIHVSPTYSMYARVTIQQRARKLLQPDSAKHPGPGLIPQPALVGHRFSGQNRRHPNCTLWTSAPYSHHNRLSVWGPLLNHGPRIVGSATLGRMAPRRKRLRDSVRDGARPTKAQRQAAADVRWSGRSPVAISSGSEEETPPVSSSSGARPLTAYGMSTGPTPPVVAAAIAEALDHDKLKGDLPPDQFMALARRLQRPYAALQVTPSASDHSRVETVETVSDEGPHNAPIGAGPDLLGDASAAVTAMDFVGPVGSFWPRTPQSTWNSPEASGTSTDRPEREFLRPTPKVRGRLQRPQESPEVVVEVEAGERSELAQPGAVIQAYTLLPERLGEPLGPASLTYCKERRDFEVRWGVNEALAVLGRPLHSDRTTRLFLSDVDLEYHGCPDDTRAPATPPTILESMRHRARLQDQAGAALRRAAASGELGDGTPPLAFTPDGDVSDFMARYLYK